MMSKLQRWNSLDIFVTSCVVCRSVLAECEGLQWISGSVIHGCSEQRLWGNGCCQGFGLALCWSSFKQEVQCMDTNTHSQKSHFHPLYWCKLSQVSAHMCFSHFPPASLMSQWNMTATPCKKTQPITSQNVQKPQISRVVIWTWRGHIFKATEPRPSSHICRPTETQCWTSTDPPFWAPQPLSWSQQHYLQLSNLLKPHQRAIQVDFNKSSHVFLLTLDRVCVHIVRATALLPQTFEDQTKNQKWTWTLIPLGAPAAVFVALPLP